MGISITQPAPSTNWPYIGRITGVKRLWGGYNLIDNQLKQMGVSDAEIASCYYQEGIDFAMEDLIFIGGGGYPSVFFDAKTGTVQEWFPTAPPTIPYTTNDRIGRYTGETDTLSSPTTYSPTSEIFYTFDQITGIRLQLPLTQDDINAINKVAAMGSSATLFVTATRAMSPAANYVAIGFTYGNTGTTHMSFVAVFKTIMELDPWIK